MKKLLFFAVVALIALASCSSEENIGIVTPPDTSVEESTPDAIMFSSFSKSVTRADHVGADAANLLNKHFTVGGFKNGAATPAVFDNYVVNWTENSAHKTESNTNDWEYVGIPVEKPSGIYVEGATKMQTIKYWDYMSSYYDFIAYSTGEATAAANKTAAQVAAGEVGVTAIDYEGKAEAAYKFAGRRVDLAKCFIADMVTVKKTDYQKVVTLKFRSLASKVRMAIYETIPGYSVKDVKFYLDDETSISSTEASDRDTEANLFTPGGVDDRNYFYDFGTFTIYYPTTGSDNEDNSDYNIAHASFIPETSGKMTTQRFGELKYTAAEYYEAEGQYYLGRSLNDASFAANKDYKIMMPNEEGTVLELRIDYTLVSTDGSGEEIHIYGAKAYVPAIYAAWKPNYAYTYFFKISDNTNGWTSNLVNPDGTTPTDPAGLYPITFDAAVVDTEEGMQSTITTVSMPSITTYQKGHDITKDEYDASDDIYIQVMQNDVLKKTNDSDHPVQVWTITGKDNATEADVMDALNKRVEYSGSTTTGRNGVTLTKVETQTGFTAIPGVDGNDITIDAGDAAKFTPASNTLYAVTYKGRNKTDISYYSAQALTEQPSDWGTSGVWYKDPAGQTPVTADFAEGTYYKKYTDRNIDWGVKVIKVE